MAFRWASQVAQWVKNLPAVQEMLEIWVRFLGQEDPLEEGTTTHSSILAWKIPWTEVCAIVQGTGIKTIPMEQKCKKQNGCLRRPYK